MSSKHFIEWREGRVNQYKVNEVKQLIEALFYEKKKHGIRNFYKICFFHVERTFNGSLFQANIVS